LLLLLLLLLRLLLLQAAACHRCPCPQVAPPRATVGVLSQQQQVLVT
jgi:hypothetical protein